MPPKIPLPTDAELAPDIRERLATLPPLNVFRMMANAPASFHALFDLATSILMQSEFDARKREIAVLRVAHVTRSRYEWVQHVRVAEMTGVTAEEIDRIGQDGPVQGLDEESTLICRVADEISRDVRLSDEALEAIVSRYGVCQATELILCCSYFNMVSRFLESTRVELEDETAL
ncbi:MAG: carboxymuconolactone decarboxylase family protein [Deltaproteobacteria bacterium]|nr:MAG: carboxymuconolactone decarboxylase family protein [Deltaproteobacteria bacterium]